MRRPPLFSSIRGRLLALNLLAAVPLVLLGLWQVSSLWHQAVEEGHDQASAIAERMEADLAGLLRDREIAMNAIAAQPRVQAMDPGVCRPLFQSLSAFYPELTAVSLRDRAGRLVCSSLPFAPTELSPDLLSAYEQGLASGRLEVSSALYAAVVDRWLAAVSIPIRDGQGGVRGLLITPIDLEALAARLAPEMPAGALVTVLDRKQQVLLRWPDMERWVGQPVPAELAGLGEAETPDRFRNDDGAGHAWLGSIATLPGAGWTIAAALPEATLLNPVRDTIVRLSALGVVLLGLFFAVTHAIYRQVVRSTDNLARLAAAIGAGRTEARAAVAGPPELANVARHMNEMLDRLETGRAETAANVERFRLVADATSSVIWDQDLAGGALWLGDNVTRLFGYDAVADRALLRDWLALVHPAERAEVAAWFAAGLAGREETLARSFRLRRRDGAYAEVRCQARILRDPQGQARRVIGAWSDETEQRKLDRQLRQFQRLEVVGQLTGGVAHDFNNLLTVILGNTDLLLERLDRQPELRRLAEVVAQAAQRGSDLTRSLLAFSRSQQLAVRRCALPALIGGLEPLLRRTLPANVELRIDLPPGLWPIAVDPALFESALLNLCLNARDALPGGGRVTLAAANRPDAAGQAAGEHVAITVTDNGVGMAPETLARVFEPFFTTKEPGKGTGLGLSMVYGFARQSSGSVDIASEPGRGTQVTLCFPRATLPAEPESGDGAAALAPGGEEHLLVVEDDLLVRDGAVRRLAGLGYRVSTAASATEALAILERAPDIALVLTDIVMPGPLDGRQLAQRIAERWPAIKVLLTSGYAKETGEAEGPVPAGWPFLAKPYRGAELAAKVRQVLERR